MWFVLRYFYPFLPINSNEVDGQIFEDLYLSKTGKLGAIYFDYICSFDADFVSLDARSRYLRSCRNRFVDELMEGDLTFLLFSMILELDGPRG